MLFTMLQRITLHEKLYNILFAYATANSFRWSLIDRLNIEVHITGRNGILFEFYYLESNFRAIAMSSCIEMGGAFSENYNLIPSSYNWGGERYLLNIPLHTRYEVET